MKRCKFKNQNKKKYIYIYKSRCSLPSDGQQSEFIQEEEDWRKKWEREGGQDDPDGRVGWVG